MSMSFRDLYFNHTEDYYKKIINLLGYENVKRCVPFTIAELKKSKDKHFNDLPLKTWDLASGFVVYSTECKHVGSMLTSLYRTVGVNSFSCSTGVSILKTCARMMIADC